MEVAPVTESGDRETAMSTSHEVTIRNSAPPQLTDTLEGSLSSSFGRHASDAHRPASAEVWAGAIARLQTQVSLNTSMLESQRQRINDIEHAIQNLDYEVAGIKPALQSIQAELRSRPGSRMNGHDPEDLEVLAGQVQAVTNKVNEVESLKMQVELLKNRMRRWEEQASPAAASARSVTAPVHREAVLHEVPPPPPAMRASLAPAQPAQYQPLPPMRTSYTTSPLESRPMPRPNQPPMLESQSTTRTQHQTEPRKRSAESSIGLQSSSAASYRPTEPLPPPSAISGWRPAESVAPANNLQQPSLPQATARPPVMEPEPSSTGWAAINTTQPPKRPLEEPRQASYETMVAGSPKRPKLAPIMPRTTSGDESSYVPPSATQPEPAESFKAHSRVASDASQPQSHALPTPASANAPAHRFIISTQPADSQDSWRAEPERLMSIHSHASSQGRRGSRGGRSRSRGQRGGRSGSSHAADPAEVNAPEWERPDWTGSKISPSESYSQLRHRYHSSSESSRGVIAKTPIDAEGELSTSSPITRTPHDPFAAGNVEQPTSGGKKSRTRPVRNAEGVLIRKDGRPDMRSVSSANNLRKVHAKKEAERIEMATSVLPAVPATPLSDEENATQSPDTSPEGANGGGEGEGKQEASDQHDKLTSNTFLSAGEGGGGKSAAEKLIPSQEKDAGDAETKTQPATEEQAQTATEKDDESRTTDVVMKEASDTHAEEHTQQEQQREDTIMVAAPKAEEVSEPA